MFLACYLVYISMVKIPARDNFLLDMEEGDRLALEFWNNNKEVQKDIA